MLIGYIYNICMILYLLYVCNFTIHDNSYNIVQYSNLLFSAIVGNTVDALFCGFTVVDRDSIFTRIMCIHVSDIIMIPLKNISYIA